MIVIIACYPIKLIRLHQLHIFYMLLLLLLWQRLDKVNDTLKYYNEAAHMRQGYILYEYHQQNHCNNNKGSKYHCIEYKSLQ